VFPLTLLSDAVHHLREELDYCIATRDDSRAGDCRGPRAANRDGITADVFEALISLPQSTKYSSNHFPFVAVTAYGIFLITEVTTVPVCSWPYGRGLTSLPISTVSATLRAHCIWLHYSTVRFLLGIDPRNSATSR
jgi:hypothetical protein